MDYDIRLINILARIDKVNTHLAAGIMRNVFKIVTVVLIVCILLGTGMALAFMPTERGIAAPKTVWSDRGITGTVNGKVVTSLDQTKGLDGAYVALVNPMNQIQEYANTTSDSDGNFHFTGVNATFSSALYKGADGSTGSYQQGMIAYMIYVNKSSIGEGYSGAFGIDTNHTTTGTGPVIIYAGLNADVSPEPTATEQPTAAPTPTIAPVTATPDPPTSTPAPEGQGLVGMLLIAAIVVLVVILAIAVYFIFFKKR